MMTPSHVAASLLLWRDEKHWRPVAAIVAGALLPDVQMFGFYAYQKLWAGRSEAEIWDTLYFDPGWQLFFDLLNSIPIAIALILVLRYFGCRCCLLMCGSALLHMCCDLPVHHDDGHRHFLPLSTWRFESPVSYWDPKHYGSIFATTELIFTMVACSYVGWNTRSLPMRLAVLSILALYLLGIGFAIGYRLLAAVE